jgi:hypothetical protein
MTTVCSTFPELDATNFFSLSIKADLHWRSFLTEAYTIMPHYKALALATLGDMTQIGTIQFALCLPRWPRKAGCVAESWSEIVNVL